MDDAEALNAILIPPQLEAFRARFSLETAPLEAVFTGYSKLAILTPDSVFLFPRHAGNVSGMEREARVLEALASQSLAWLPGLLGRWQDDDIYPHPFIATSRMSGVSLARLIDKLPFDALMAFMRNLGEVLAGLHQIPLSCLPPDLHQFSQVPLSVWHRKVTGGEVESAVIEAVDLMEGPLRLGAQARVVQHAWIDALAPLSGIEDCVIHGDVCENQFLVDESSLAIYGVIDWGESSAGNPLANFDFG